MGVFVTKGVAVEIFDILYKMLHTKKCGTPSCILIILNWQQGDTSMRHNWLKITSTSLLFSILFLSGCSSRPNNGNLTLSTENGDTSNPSGSNGSTSGTGPKVQTSNIGTTITSGLQTQADNNSGLMTSQQQQEIAQAIAAIKAFYDGQYEALTKKNIDLLAQLKAKDEEYRKQAAEAANAIKDNPQLKAIANAYYEIANKVPVHLVYEPKTLVVGQVTSKILTPALASQLISAGWVYGGISYSVYESIDKMIDLLSADEQANKRNNCAVEMHFCNVNTNGYWGFANLTSGKDGDPCAGIGSDGYNGDPLGYVCGERKNYAYGQLSLLYRVLEESKTISVVTTPDDVFKGFLQANQFIREADQGFSPN